MPSEMDALHAVFFEEATELLAEIENTFLALETAPEDDELLNTIFRCVHSIKGAASMFGFTKLLQFAHDFESVLDLLLRASDMLLSCAERAKVQPPENNPG